MTAHQAITIVYNATRKDGREDLVHDVFLKFYTMDETFILHLQAANKLQHYILRSIHNAELDILRQGKKVILTETFKDIPENQTDDISEFVNAVKKLPWYHEAVINLYAQEGSIAKVSEKTGIPKSSIFETIKASKKLIHARLSK